MSSCKVGADVEILLLISCLTWIPHVSGRDRIIVGYLTGSQIPNSSKLYLRPGRLISGALTYAIESINRDHTVLPHTTLQFMIGETYGQEVESIKQTVLLMDKNISVYIGPQETCVHEGRIAASFNLPMISYYCSATEVSDKKLYPTFARTNPPDSQISQSLVSLLKLYNWRKVTFLHSNEDKYAHTADTICDVLEEHGIDITFRRVYPGPYFHKHVKSPFAKIVSETRDDTRIYVMLGAHYEFIGLMDNLHEVGLLDSGEYFVVGVDTNRYELEHPQAYLQGLFQKEVTNQSVEEFRHFVGVVPSPWPLTPKKHFTGVVNQYLEKSPFYFSNPFKHAGAMRRIPQEAAYLYDAVWLYAWAADAVLRDGGDVRDGKKIIETIKGMTYRGVMGFMDRINSDGDAVGSFSLVARRPLPDKPGQWGLLPIALFELSNNRSELPELHFESGEKMDWVSGHPPVDRPGSTQAPRPDEEVSPSPTLSVIQEEGQGSDDEERCVTLFGFTPDDAAFIVEQFTQFGNIVNNKSPVEGNWIDIYFQTRVQAEKALSENGKVFKDSIMIGVLPCSDKNVVVGYADDADDADDAAEGITTPTRRQDLDHGL